MSYWTGVLRSSFLFLMVVLCLQLLIHLNDDSTKFKIKSHLFWIFKLIKSTSQSGDVAADSDTHKEALRLQAGRTLHPAPPWWKQLSIYCSCFWLHRKLRMISGSEIQRSDSHTVSWHVNCNAVTPVRVPGEHPAVEVSASLQQPLHSDEVLVKCVGL